MSKDTIIKMMDDMGIIKSLKRANSVATKLFDNYNEKTARHATKEAIKHLLADDDNEEFRDAFFEYSMDLAIDSIVDSLDLKADEEVEPDRFEKLAAIMALIEHL